MRSVSVNRYGWINRLLFWPCCWLWVGMPVVLPVMAVAQVVQVEADGNGDVPSVVLGGEALPVAEQKPKKQGLPQVRSLFFSAQEMVAIKKALASYTPLATGEEPGDALDLLGQLRKEDVQQKPRYFVYPQFYLASLVYHSANDWSVRINDQKMTYASPETAKGIRVLAIDKDKVTVEWSPEDMKKVEDVWKASPNSQADVDVKRGVVTFTLRPNQTFSSYVMKVLEGKVMPMVIDLAPPSEGTDKPSLRPVQDTPKTASGDMVEDLLGRGDAGKAP